MYVTFSPTTWYRLTKPNGDALDVINDAGALSTGRLQITALGNYSGQFWQIRPHADRDGSFELFTWFLGSIMRLGVGDGNTIVLRREGGKWTFVPVFELVEDEGGRGHKFSCDGTYEMINVDQRDAEDEASLDMFGSGLTAGQSWKITPIQEIRSSCIDHSG